MEGSSRKRQHVPRCEPGNGDGGGNSEDKEVYLKKRRVGNGVGPEGDDLGSWIGTRQQQQEQDGQQLGGQDRLPSVDMDSVGGSQDLMTEISEQGDGINEAMENSGSIEDGNDETKSFDSWTAKDAAVLKRGILGAASDAKKIRVHLPEGYHSSKYGVDAGRDIAMLNNMEGGQVAANGVVTKGVKADDEIDGSHAMALVPYVPLPIHALVQHMSTDADEARSEQQSGSMEIE